MATNTPMPVLFAAHGAPMTLEDVEWMADFARWSATIQKPKAILMVSAHWENRPLCLGATTSVPLLYDFSGFPNRFYQTNYSSPGAPALAERVRALLRASDLSFVENPRRGLDHGAYIPLVGMHPKADVPVLQVSMPVLEPRALFAFGRALSSLREEGVLLIGSGFLTHNMAFAFRPGVPSWAIEFDAWAREALLAFDVDALLDFQNKAPGAHLALPSWEHYAPLLFAVGAVGRRKPTVRFPIEGFWMQTAFTKRSVQFD